MLTFVAIMKHRHTFNKKEKLKSKNLIDQLFIEGQSVSCYPLRLVYLPVLFEDGITIKASVAVSKRLFKRAVERNNIKRLIRESYRLNKNSYFNNSTTHYALMILYIGNKKPTYSTIEDAMTCVLKKLKSKVQND